MWRFAVFIPASHGNSKTTQLPLGKLTLNSFLIFFFLFLENIYEDLSNLSLSCILQPFELFLVFPFKPWWLTTEAISALTLFSIRRVKTTLCQTATNYLMQPNLFFFFHQDVINLIPLTLELWTDDLKGDNRTSFFKNFVISWVSK